MMHRANLQRVDRCSMRFELEIREPFLDLAVVEYACGLDATALAEDGRWRAPRASSPCGRSMIFIRASFPPAIRDRRKIQFDEGAGIDSEGAGWPALFEEALSDAEFQDGKREFRGVRDRNQGRTILSARPCPPAWTSIVSRICAGGCALRHEEKFENPIWR